MGIEIIASNYMLENDDTPTSETNVSMPFEFYK